MHRISIAEGQFRRRGAPSIWIEGVLHEEGNHWLNWDVMVASDRPNTWKQAAQCVKEYLDWCIVMEANWRVASREFFIEWRDAQLNSVSPKTGQPYHPNTVRVRMSYVLRFLDYAAAQGWYSGSIPFDSYHRGHHFRIDEDTLAHTRKGSRGASQRNKLLPKQRSSDVISILRRSEITALFEQVGPRPTQRDPDSSGSARDWLIIGIPLFSGLRKEELLSLTVYPFNAIVVDPEKPFLSHDIRVLGKGDKERAVSFPGWLVMDIQAYVAGERKCALANRTGQGRRESQLLLVNSGHPKAGQPLKIGAINAAVERLMQAAGLVAEKPVINAETGERGIRTVCKYSMHSLRHTYAVLAYHTYREIGEPDPWKLIQMQLGHSSPSTTLNVYLKYVQLFNENRSDLNLLKILNA